jgi:hypothetical protein
MTAHQFTGEVSSLPLRRSAPRHRYFYSAGQQDYTFYPMRSARSLLSTGTAISIETTVLLIDVLRCVRCEEGHRRCLFADLSQLGEIRAGDLLQHTTATLHQRTCFLDLADLTRWEFLALMNLISQHGD